MREKPRACSNAPTCQRAHYTPAATDSCARKEKCYAVQILPLPVPPGREDALIPAEIPASRRGPENPKAREETLRRPQPARAARQARRVRAALPRRCTRALYQRRRRERHENAKVEIKVSGCFRAQAYGETHARISSYMQSMAALGYNPLVAIQIALAGQAADVVKQHDGPTLPEA